MKHEKYLRNIYVYQLKYLNEWNLKKDFQALKSGVQSANFIKFLQVLRAFQKLLASPTTFIKVVCESHELRKVARKFYELCKVFSHFW